MISVLDITFKNNNKKRGQLFYTLSDIYNSIIDLSINFTDA